MTRNPQAVSKPLEQPLSKPRSTPVVGERLTWLLLLGLGLYLAPLAFEGVRAYLTGGELPELFAMGETPRFAYLPGLKLLYWLLLG